ncbi:MAG: ABC transporter permease subunit [Lentisphaeria bacterium]|nr:ABC transporter permease subunit [Lentisphaeria bacterium]
MSFWKIAANTFLESIREPIYFIMLFCAFIIIGNMPGLTLFVFFQQLKMVIDSSMATTLIFGMIVLVLSASNTLAREMRNGTVLLLMSKPVHRWVFVTAKVCGIIASGVLFTVLCHFATLIAIFTASDQFRFNMYSYVGFFLVLIVALAFGLFMNFQRNSSFSELTIKSLVVLLPIWTLVCKIICDKPEVDISNVMYAMVLVSYAVSIMGTLAVVIAIKFDVVANLFFCTILFFGGLLSGYLFQRETDFVLIKLIQNLFYAILPNWQYFWLADSVALGRMIPGKYLLYGGLYTILYIFVVSFWAIAFFQTREIAKDSR